MNGGSKAKVARHGRESKAQSRQAVMGNREPVKSCQSCVGSLRREKRESRV